MNILYIDSIFTKGQPILSTELTNAVILETHLHNLTIWIEVNANSLGIYINLFKYSIWSIIVKSIYTIRCAPITEKVENILEKTNISRFTMDDFRDRPLKIGMIIKIDFKPNPILFGIKTEDAIIHVNVLTFLHQSSTGVFWIFYPIYISTIVSTFVKFNIKVVMSTRFQITPSLWLGTSIVTFHCVISETVQGTISIRSILGFPIISEVYTGCRVLIIPRNILPFTNISSNSSLFWLGWNSLALAGRVNCETLVSRLRECTTWYWKYLTKHLPLILPKITIAILFLGIQPGSPRRFSSITMINYAGEDRVSVNRIMINNQLKDVDSAIIFSTWQVASFTIYHVIVTTKIVLFEWYPAIVPCM